MKLDVLAPRQLVDINSLDDATIEDDADGLTIGALARMSDVAAHPSVSTAYPAIAEFIAAQRQRVSGAARVPVFRALSAERHERRSEYLLARLQHAVARVARSIWHRLRDAWRAMRAAASSPPRR